MDKYLQLEDVRTSFIYMFFEDNLVLSNANSS